MSLYVGAYQSRDHIFHQRTLHTVNSHLRIPFLWVVLNITFAKGYIIDHLLPCPFCNEVYLYLKFWNILCIYIYAGCIYTQIIYINTILYIYIYIYIILEYHKVYIYTLYIYTGCSKIFYSLFDCPLLIYFILIYVFIGTDTSLMS